VFISNCDIMKDVFYCNRRMAILLVDKYKQALLGVSGDKYVFSRTESLVDIINNLSWFERLFYK